MGTEKGTGESSSNGDVKSGGASPSYAQMTTGKSQVELDLDSIKYTFETYLNLRQSQDDDELQEFGTKLQILYHWLLGLEHFDEPTAEFVHKVPHVLRQSGRVSVWMSKHVDQLKNDVKNLQDQIRKLEEKLISNTVYGDWVRSFHEVIAEELQLYTLQALSRALYRETEKANKDGSKKWTKPRHVDLQQLLERHGLSVSDWERSVHFRRSRNEASHGRELDKMKGEWKAKLTEDLLSLQSVGEINVEDKSMLSKILKCFPNIYAPP